MERYIFLLCLSLSQVISQDDYATLNTTFNLKPTGGKVVSLPGCNGIEGTTSGCAECYLCSDPTIIFYKNNGTKVDTFLLKDSKCKSTNLCCISQYAFLSGERSSSECGKSNPNGYPRRRKPSPRANLPGEYPWRAWITKRMSPAQTLCAATLVHTRALVTLASCVAPLAAESLSVAFLRGGERYNAEEVVVHHQFHAGSGANDIAVVRLSQFERVPHWVQVSCFPSAPPTHGAACQAVSSGDKTINSVIPLRSACASGAALHQSQLCGAAPRGDFAPERGAGLYCVQQYGNQPAYVYYGIAQSTDKDSITVYTDVSQYRAWLETTLHISLF